MVYRRSCIINFLLDRYRPDLQILNQNDWRERIIHFHYSKTTQEFFLHVTPSDDKIEYSTIARMLQRLGITEILTHTDLKTCAIN